MSYEQLITILKGGAGSGNWGHSGRYGKVGGSNRGGGLQRIGARSEVPNLFRNMPVKDYRRMLANEFKRQRKQLQPLIDQVAAELGYDSHMIEYAGEPFKFTVGGQNYTAGGTYHPDTRRIRLYEGAFTPDKSAVYKGLVAHEIQHDRFNTFRKVVDAQRKEIVARRDEEQKTVGYDWRTSFEKVDGTFRDPKDNKRYAAYLLNDKLTDPKTYKSLHKADGVTGYSASYWRDFDTKGKRTDDYYKAINETLAEVASLKATGNWDKVKAPWKGLYNEVSKYAIP